MTKHYLVLCLIVFVHYTKCQTQEEELASIAALLQESATYTYPTNYNEYNTLTFFSEEWYEIYDFIIIGAGTAGGTVANRLTENPNFSVLLLEAGGNDSLVTDIPALAPYLQSSHYNWGYQSTPQTTCCLGMNNKKCNVPRGKVLGGSSTINFMMYVRGNRKDFDKWAEAGNTGWSYDELLPYFKKAENSSLNNNYDPAYHGTTGPVHVEHVRHFNYGQTFLDANAELGRKILDYNGQEQMGYSRLQSNTINGRRCSSNKAYITPASTRPNLNILTGAFVTKIKISEPTLTAWGVEFIYGNRKFVAKARKEIILSAGAVGSPKILMHSGIGPKSELEKHNIPVLADLPVGQNMHDHMFMISPIRTNFLDTSAGPMESMVADYLNFDGYLTAAGNIQAIGISNTLPGTDGTTIEQIFIPMFVLNDGALPVLLNYDSQTFTEYFGPYLPFSSLLIHVLFYPESRGNITLKSDNVFDFPNINLNFYSNTVDLDRLAAAIQDVKTIIATQAFGNSASLVPNPLTACNASVYDSPEYSKCLVRYISSSIYHLAGTCKMGPDNDPTSVVDNYLKVRGIHGLRVIDASIMPTPLAAHTSTATIVIGEKGSDMIKKDYA